MVILKASNLGLIPDNLGLILDLMVHNLDLIPDNQDLIRDLTVDSLDPTDNSNNQDLTDLMDNNLHRPQVAHLVLRARRKAKNS